jgi:hypothetical protein
MSYVLCLKYFIFFASKKMFEAKRSEYLKKRIFSNEYSLECEIRFRIGEYSLQNLYFETNIRQYEKMNLFCIKSNICMRICANILKRI